jgi:hypothetical protein
VAAGRRILLAYLVYFGAIGASYPYLPVFYRDLGVRLEEIGLLTAIQAATQLVLGPIAACGALALVGAVVIGYAVLGERAAIGPARALEDPGTALGEPVQGAPV